MDYRILIYKVLALFFLLLPISLTSQISAVEGRFAIGENDPVLTEQFREYRTYHLDTRMLVDIVRDEQFRHRLDLNLPGYGKYDIELFENPLQAPNYLLSVQTENGIIHTPSSGIVKTFRGNLKGGQYVVSLTIDEGFVYGFIQLPGKDLLEIEPLRWYLKHADRDALIVFKASDRLRTSEIACGVKHPPLLKHGEDETHEMQHSAVVCKAIQIAFANDWLMYDDHGNNIPDVENHNMGVINNVQNNFDTEFDDDLQFQVVQIWVSTCSTCDPWTNSTNAGTLLDAFTDWGPSGFSNTHDVANLWTNRDFNGPTVGISWIEAVCTPFRYLTTQDFTNDAGSLRSLLAHELGHNFGATHDPEGSQTIMAPSLVVTNTWSTQSITQINNYIDDINCLGPCSGTQAPVADFDADEVSGCNPFEVQFFDESSGSPTAWEWTFPGGTPSFSVQQNPVVTYNNPGTFDVALEVSNAGGTHSIVKQEYITVLPSPVADFSYSQSDLSFTFISQALNANTHFWEFGDGSSSIQQHPQHTYASDGEYEVSLTVTNACGEDTYTIFVEVSTPPNAGFSYTEDFGCAPLIVQFINESSANVQSLLWVFPGGTPSSSTQEFPTVQYNTPGIYSVTLIVQNNAGTDELTINNLIEVASAPDAGFSYSVNGLSVQFNNSSTNAEAYLWTFGDGASSTSVNPVHVYPEGGIYQVTLSAANACGPDVHIATVSLTSAPVAGFVTSISSGCAPLSVMYTSTSTGTITSYNWSFPGGAPSSSNAALPTVVYNAPGTYDAQLIVGNSVGFDTLYMEDVITVYTDVNSSFVANVNGTTVNFLNTSTGSFTYNWQINGSTYGTQHVSYTFPGDGDYPVQLIATGQCGSDTSVQIVHITSALTAGIASNVTSGCQPLTVQFYNASSANATTFAWVFEGGFPATSSAPNPAVQYSLPGSYDVKLTVWSASSSDMLELTDMIVVEPRPVSAFSTIQTGLQVEFNNTSSYADQHLWIFGDGETSAELHPVHQYSGFGTYQVMLIVHNSCGADTLTEELSITGTPVPAFTANLTEGCIPFEVQFTDMSQNSPTLWEWSFPGGNPDTTNLRNPVIVYEHPGTYMVRLRVSNIAGTMALTREEYIHVANPPVAAFSFLINDGHVVFNNQSINGSRYLWNFGDGWTDTTSNPVHLYEASGLYKVELIVINACSADTVVQEIIVTVTAVDDLHTLTDVRVYPNPNSGIFTIQISDTDEAYDLEVFNLLGRSVHQAWLNPNSSGSHDVQLDDVEPGVYSVVLQKHNFRQVVKIIVL